MSFTRTDRRGLASLIRWVAAVLAMSCGVCSTHALTINLTLNTDFSHNDDPGSAKLAAVMQAAADHWEDIIEDFHVVEVEFGYQNLDGMFLAQAPVLTNNGRPLTAAVLVDNLTSGGADRGWYYDTTPNNHSEYDMQQVLARDIDDQSDFFNHGTPPDLLEVGYGGDAFPAASADARNNVDLYSVLLHELGHIIGHVFSRDNTEIDDGDYDINPNLIFGNTLGAVTFAANQPEHLLLGSTLMFPSFGNGERRLPSALDVFAMATGPLPEWSQIDLPRQDFWGGGDFNTPFNWEGNQVPGSFDDAYIRHGGFVTMSSTSTVQNLFVGENADLATNGSQLVVIDTIEISDFGSRIIVVPGLAANQLDADRITVTNEGRLQMSGGIAEVDVILGVDANATVMGNGTIRFVNGAGTRGFRLDGTLSVDGGAMTLVAVNDTLLDLDGINGNGTVTVVSGTSNLIIDGALFDDFDGTINIGEGNVVTFTEPWTFGRDDAALALMNLQGGASGATSATLDGATVNANSGTIKVTGFADIDSDIEFQPGIAVDVAADSQLRLNGLTTFNGGSFTGDGVIQLNGDTDVTGATTVNMPGGYVDLDGATIAGQQITLHNRSLTLNVAAIDSPGSSPSFGNEIIDLNGALAQLTVNLTDPGANWEMAGTINIEANDFVATTSLDGSDLLVSGTINADGRTRIDARLDLAGEISTSDATAEVEIRGGTTAHPNTIDGGTVTGPGTLIAATDVALHGNGTIDARINFSGASNLLASGGVLTLNGMLFDLGNLIGTADASGNLRVANLWNTNLATELRLNGGTVGGANITNGGLTTGEGTITANSFANTNTVSPGLSTGILGFIDYRQTPSGRLVIELGGTVPGSRHDQITTRGDAVLDGQLNLSVVPGYNAQFGHVMTIVDSIGFVTGVFSQITGIDAGNGLSFAVLYSPHTVEVHPTLPGDLNVDGQVTIADLSQLALNFGLNSHATWIQGDVTGDGIVNIGDLSRLATHFGQMIGMGGGLGETAQSNQVPAPATLPIFAVAACGTRRWKRPRKISLPIDVN